MRHYFRRQCRAAFCRLRQQEPSVIRISPNSDHDSGGREIEDAHASERDLRQDDRGERALEGNVDELGNDDALAEGGGGAEALGA